VVEAKAANPAKIRQAFSTDRPKRSQPHDLNGRGERI
jgi:hypothetical protein